MACSPRLDRNVMRILIPKAGPVSSHLSSVGAPNRLFGAWDNVHLSFTGRVRVFPKGRPDPPQDFQLERAWFPTIGFDARLIEVDAPRVFLGNRGDR